MLRDPDLVSEPIHRAGLSDHGVGSRYRNQTREAGGRMDLQRCHRVLAGLEEDLSFVWCLWPPVGSLESIQEESSVCSLSSVM